MRFFIRRFAAYSWLLAVTGLVLFAILVAVARLMLPMISDYRQVIQSEVSVALGKSVTIGRIEGEWDGILPRIRLDDVRVFVEGADKAPLSFERAYVKPKYLASLFEGRFQINQVSVIGADLSFLRQEDGAIILSGFELQQVPDDARREGLIDSLNEVTLSLLKSRVRWIDRTIDVEYQFDEVNITLQSAGERHRLSASMVLPEHVGKDLRVGVDFTGRLSEPGGWSGQVYANAVGMSVGALAERSIAKRYGLDKGILDLESWSDWQQGRPVRVHGSLGIHEAGLDLHENRRFAGAAADLDSLQSNFYWLKQEHGWLLDIDGLDVSIGKQSWPRTGIGVEYTAMADGVRALRLSSDYLKIQDLLPFLLAQSWLHDDVAEQLIAHQPAAELSDTKLFLRLDANGLQGYSASGRFLDLGFHARGNVPGASGLDGEYSFDSHGGELILESRDAHFAYPRWFVKGFDIDEVNGLFEWQDENSEIRLSSSLFTVRNNDIDVQGRVNMRISDAAPHLDLQLAYANGDISKVKDYLPQKIMRPKVVKWLTEGLLAGRIKSGGLVFLGPLDQFPFRKGEGVFEARADVVDGVLNYKPGWPQATGLAGELLFRNQSLTADAQSGRILDSVLKQGEIQIKDFWRAAVEIEGRLQGPAGDALGYLIQTSLLNPQGAVAAQLETRGAMQTDLDITLPLGAKSKAVIPLRVAGRAKLNDAYLRIKSVDLAFENINGMVEFTPEGSFAKDVSAILRGRPVEISATPGPDNTTQVNIEGQLSAETLLRDVRHPLADMFKGSTMWNAWVGIPAYGKSSGLRSMPITLTSDLMGVVADLPAPFMKDGTNPREFVLSTQIIEGREHNPIRIQYGQDVSAVFEVAGDKAGTYVPRAELRVNRGEAQLPNKGLHVNAGLHNLSMNDWQQWLRDHPDINMPGKQTTRRPSLLESLSMQVANLQWSGQTFSDFNITLNRQNDAWLGYVEAPLLKGKISVPLEMKSGIPMELDLDYLQLNAGMGEKNDVAIDPRQLPALRVNSKVFKYNDIELADLHLEATRLEEGLQVHNFQFSGPHFSVRAHGDWLALAAKQQQSKFRINIDSDQVAKALAHAGIKNIFHEGTAEIEADVHWPDAPHHFAFIGLNGRAQVRIRDGRLRDIEPGAGRLLGLFNLGVLSRRLTLDFSDIFKEGFGFDKIQGNLSFVDADVYTNDLLIKGPSAEVEIKGRTGLVARDYDQIVTVVPQFGAGLPIAGAVIGGTGVGAAVLVLERAMRSLGADISRVGQIEYQVKGAWDAPVIERIQEQTEELPIDELDDH